MTCDTLSTPFPPHRRGGRPLWTAPQNNKRKLINLLFKLEFADSTGKVTDHRITGQFRNKSSRIWDPHPQYLIDAFGMHLHLLLYQDGNFIPNDMKVI